MRVLPPLLTPPDSLKLGCPRRISTITLQMSDHDFLSADHSVAESTSRLPAEILHLILDAYSSSRLKELEYDRRQASKERIPAWPVLPILLSCKLLSGMFLPKLYSHTVILRHGTLFSFLNDPAYGSYGHIRCLEVRNTRSIPPYPRFGTLDIEDAMDFWSFCYISKGYKGWGEEERKYRFQGPDWADGHLPRVEVAKLDAEDRRYIKLVLAL